jgi:hypothetical protein
MSNPEESKPGVAAGREFTRLCRSYAESIEAVKNMRIQGTSEERLRAVEECLIRHHEIYKSAVDTIMDVLGIVAKACNSSGKEESREAVEDHSHQPAQQPACAAAATAGAEVKTIPLSDLVKRYEEKCKDV